MLTPAIAEQLERLLEYHAKGVFGKTELAHHLGHLISPDNVLEVMGRLPADLIDSAKEGIGNEVQDTVDAEHLQPESSPFTALPIIAAFHSKIAAMLLESDKTQTTRLATVVCLPSFEPEWAIRVVGTKRNGHSLVLTQSVGKIWPPSDASPQIARTETPIPVELASSLCDLWQNMLMHTRHPKRGRLGLDGVSYHFTYHVRGAAEMAGKVWSPDPNTAPGHLVQLSHTLMGYIQAEDALKPTVTDRLLEQLDWFQNLA